MIQEKGIEESPALLKDDVEYFNLEVSPEGTTLVFNASKGGIDTFLRSYGHLEIPPKAISFKESSRPIRQWYSWDIEDKQDISAKDLTPYKVSNIGGYYKNQLMNNLYIQFLDQKQEKLILAAGMKENKIKLSMNKKGWQAFLTLVRHLRDKSYWFYVTPPNPLFPQDLPCVLTLPYPGEPGDHIFKAIEFIRLEPDKEIYLRIFDGFRVRANSGGLLLFSKWMHDFSISNTLEKVVCNQWNTMPKSLLDDPSNQYVLKSPTWLHLRRINADLFSPIFSFEKKDDQNDNDNLYIFGNTKGFEELAEITEEYAFYFDYDVHCKRPQHIRYKGAPVERVLGPEGFRSLGSWELVGGGLFTPKYNPLRFISSPANPSIFSSEDEVKRNFLNERVLLKDEID